MVMKQGFAELYRRYLVARQRRADALVLEYLDARTLKDIGLEGSPVARRASARQRRDALTWWAILNPSAGGLR